MASSWMYSLITSKILLRAFKSSEAFNHDTSTVYHISKLINKTITISLSFTPLRKKVREKSLRRHLPTSILFNTHYSGLPDMTSSIWLTQDTKNEGNTCRLCFFDMYGLCSVYSSFCKYTSTEDSHPWWIESLSVRICL